MMTDLMTNQTIDQIALVVVVAAGVLVVALGVAIVVMGWKDADAKEDDDELK